MKEMHEAKLRDNGCFLLLGSLRFYADKTRRSDPVGGTKRGLVHRYGHYVLLIFWLLCNKAAQIFFGRKAQTPQGIWAKR